MNPALLTTWVICSIIALVMVVAIFKKWNTISTKNPSTDWINSAPSVTSTLGIFGTFFGIFLGLMDFDTANIDTSIPLLLDGLKTAFITSLVGMLASLLLRLVFSHINKRHLELGDSGGDDPIEYLNTIATNSKLSLDSLTTLSDTIVSCFRSDEEYSLISQLKLIRTEMSDLRRDVKSSLEEFSSKVAEIGTGALIEALKEVIGQFNEKLSDLVGTEFKQLRDSMIQLNHWQEQHRVLVEEQHGRLTAATESLASSAELMRQVSAALATSGDGLNEIVAATSRMTLQADALQSSVDTLKSENERLNEFLHQIAELGAKAQNTLPEISRHLNELGAKMVSASEQTRTKIESAGTLLQSNWDSMQRRVQEAQSQSVSQINESIKKVNDELERALTGSLETLGSQLAALSMKFVSDYTPLTDRLREVLRLAEGLKNAR